MSNSHTPVLLREVLTALAPKENGIYVDATFGAGGYSRAILDAAHCTVYAFDRDPNAIDRAGELAAEYKNRLILINRPFSEMIDALAERGVDSVDGIVFDLGVSSMQLDEADRGFSFRFDGPLSMRMDQAKPDAADVIAHADAKQLASIFKLYGEEKRATAIAKKIVARRDEAPIVTTAALASLAEEGAPKFGTRKIHPATRIFQALRIFVNDEIGQLVSGLHASETLLRPGGRLVVVTFHSLEDRVVKRFLVSRAATSETGSRHAPPTAIRNPSFEKVLAKAVTPQETELTQNPRSRSAKLRASVRRAAPVTKRVDDDLGVPHSELLQKLERELSL